MNVVKYELAGSVTTFDSNIYSAGYSIGTGIFGKGSALILGAPLAPVNDYTYDNCVTPSAGSGTVFAYLYNSTFPTSFPSQISPSYFNGNNGFYITGSNPNSCNNFLGQTLSLGDFTGSGFGALAIGAPGETSGSFPKGVVHIIYGTTSIFPSSITTNYLNGTTGMFIVSINSNSNIGNTINMNGDVNGDGKCDLGIGDASTNSAYFLWGNINYYASTVVPPLTSDNGFTITCSNCQTGTFATTITTGNVNNDAFADIVIGAPGSHSVFLIYGNSSLPVSFDVSSLISNPSLGKVVYSSTTHIGSALAIGNNIKGDNTPSLIIGAPSYNSSMGSVYVVYNNFTQSPGNFSVDSLNGINGVMLTGQNQGDQFGSSVAIVDFNQDGYGDVIAGAPYAPYTGGSSGNGRACVFYGASNLSSPIKAINASAIFNGQLDPNGYKESFGYALGIWGNSTNGYTVVSQYCSADTAYAAVQIIYGVNFTTPTTTTTTTTTTSTTSTTTTTTTTTSTTSTTTTATPLLSSEPSSSGGLAIWEIVLIAAGGTLVVGGMAYLIYTRVHHGVVPDVGHEHDISMTTGNPLYEVDSHTPTDNTVGYVTVAAEY